MALGPDPTISRQAEKNQDSAIQPNHVLIVEAADPLPEPSLGNCGELVHHQPRGQPQAVPLARRNEQAKQGSLGFIRGEDADRDRGAGIEPIVLYDHGRTRFAGITGTRNRPYFAALHASPKSEIASTKS